MNNFENLDQQLGNKPCQPYKEIELNSQNSLIIDCFCGGGGASVGIEMALGRAVDIAINHDPAAILMHKTNHPDTLHLTEDIFEVDLQKHVKGRKVSLMWASPDCTSHSKAKGGKPREKGLRILPMAVHEHAKQIIPEVIIMENVEEIKLWGPLNKKGYPIKKLRGRDYKKFMKKMYLLGYHRIETKELIAADYGAPTTRKRWYAIFRRDGKQITWPEQTHSKNGVNGLLPWVPVSTVLDFTNMGKSIFGRKKPLAENTMNRIARGMDKFVFSNPEPFIMKCYGGGYKGAGSSMSEPLHTITTIDHNALVTPYIVPIGYGEAPGQLPRVSSVKDPVGTIVASGNKHYLCSPYIMQIGQTGFTQERNRSVLDPVSTIVTKQEHCLISPLLIQYHSETVKGEVRGQSVAKPIKTIDTTNRYGLVMAFLSKFYKSGTGQRINEPLHTITTSPGHFGQVSILTVDRDILLKNGISEESAQKCTWVSQFIEEYYGQGVGQSVRDPLHTIVTKDRFALVTILGNEYVILDIFLRMLTAEELKKGQGFPDDYIIDRDHAWNPYPIKEKVARIGNSVVPIMAKALVSANCGYLKVGDRRPGMNLTTQSMGQLKFA